MKIAVLNNKCYNQAHIVTSGDIIPTVNGLVTSNIKTDISFSSKDYGVDTYLPANFFALDRKQQNHYLSLNKDKQGNWLSSKAYDYSLRLTEV